MGDDGWSRAWMAAAGVPVAGGRGHDPLRAIVMEARAAGLARARLLELAQHRAPEVREAIAARGDCPLGMQASLAHDRRASVRRAVASGPALAPAVAAVLATDRDVAVLKALARNARTPRAVAEALARHRRDDVARLARRALTGDGGHGAAVPGAELADRSPSATGGTRLYPQAPASPAAHSPAGDRPRGVLAPRPEVPRRAPSPRAP